MDPCDRILPTPVQTLPFPSRSPPTSPASHALDVSPFFSSSGLIETQFPAISQIIDFSSPSSSSSHPMPFQSMASSSTRTLEPKSEYLPGVSCMSSPSDKSLPLASVVVDIPSPLESLQSSPVPPFLSKTYEIVSDPSLDRIVSWTPAGQSFVVWDTLQFSRIVLPRHFKHSNFSSFLRQLNTYGFRKIDGDRWEFANEEFLRGKKKLLKNITRRKSPRAAQPKGPHFGSSMGMELLVAEDELQKLRSEKHMLTQEVVKLKQEHLATIKEMDELNCRLQLAELRQKQMISFWAKVLRSPVFLMQLKKTKKLREIASTSSIKRSIEQAQPSKPSVNKSTTQQIVNYGQSFCEPGSAFVLQGLESNSETELTDHILQDASDKLGHDVHVQDGNSNKPLEILEPSFNQNAASKGKNKLISKEDANLGSDDFYTSSPEDFSSNKMVVEPISSSGESSTHKVLQIDTISGKSVGDVFQWPLFLYSVKPGDEISCKEELCDVDFEAGGCFSSDHDVWDNIFCTNPVVPGDEIGLSEMWDFGLHSDEGFDIDKCFISEFPLLPDMDEDGLRDDHPKKL